MSNPSSPKKEHFENVEINENKEKPSSPVAESSPAKVGESQEASSSNNNDNNNNSNDSNRRKSRLRNMSGLSGLMFMIAFIILAFGIAQIAVATQKDDLHVRHTWGILINGIFCVILGLFGLSVVFCPFVAICYKLYAVLNLFVFLEAIVLYIIYSGLVHRYIRKECNGDFGWNSFCYDLEKYLGISLAVFWCFNIFVLPASLITSIALVKANEDDNNDNRSNDSSA
ncbi:hypothetical protein PPL_03985 [Heterostelium album PN500]|uniref:MARVEL domain-containing protein n=1 Tax=Heterostelium pallidum (strain ATCC 26659 / Pp 5 / PN500) TaxID=670386 RepID=D3B5P7_HETP5|nr:hypothetical protein PPL_03985 [Heterostelium album PN500]EFA83195.1 hypothetical protein PPL_03985 [Heterostelium album PN500]|eukprot:XP_020435312.1 hypothetical protein PPL_03985 [Heterostelium album PN500]